MRSMGAAPFDGDNLGAVRRDHRLSRYVWLASIVITLLDLILTPRRVVGTSL